MTNRTAPLLFLALVSSCACEKRTEEAPIPPRKQESVEAPKTEYPKGAKNRLVFEKSPYLRQHADNPVDWHPWGKEAFERARKEGKPVFLSIGYSTCHWCHVMERESFMDEGIAALLKEHFVSIKLDREERPDIDQVYMTACQLLTGGGGWPLTIFMTGDKKPFFAGTYFPPDDRWGRTGFKTLLQRIAEAWKSQRDKILADADKLSESIRSAGKAAESELKKDLLDSGAAAFKAMYDEKYGGFKGRNKFPRTIVLEFLLRHHLRTGDPKSLEMVEKTLAAMRDGGIYDQLGGGFHRYATDERWLVPHFEKMLYDQALLVRAYIQTYQLTGKAEYAATARETLEFVLREMTSKEGGFFSAYDADSDLPGGGGHAEGAFYVWTPAKVKSLVPGRDGEVLCRALGVVEGGNFEPIEEHEPKGNSVLHAAVDVDTLAREFRLTAEEVRSILQQGRRKLFEARRKRPAPHLDDKILTDWNALMIGSLAFAGSVLEEPRYVAAAERAAGLLLSKLRKQDGRWLHRYTDGHAGIDAFLDDYAFLSEGLFLLHQATQKLEYLEAAVRTAELMIQDFGDAQGGFFHTAGSGEVLIARMKEAYDGAVPSGNSAATLALLRLADLSSREDFRKKAEETLRNFAGTLTGMEPAHPYHLCALDQLVGPSLEVVLVGDSNDPRLQEMIRATQRMYLPRQVVAVTSSEPNEQARRLIPLIIDRPMLDGRASAYVCLNSSCRAPTNSLDELRRQLRQGD